MKQQTRYSLGKMTAVNKIVRDNNVNNLEHTIAFKSWVSLGYNRGYRDAINYLEAKYARVYKKGEK